MKRSEFSEILAEARANEDAAVAQLVPLVYDELRRIAAHCMRGERADHTLQPTALVNELYFRLAGGRVDQIASKQHFLALAARVMRHILVDHARGHGRGKRGGDLVKVLLDDVMVTVRPPDVDVLAISDALDRLATIDPVQARIVELRYFGGYEVTEIAEMLGISATTVKREWATAKLWLRREMLRGSDSVE